MARGFTGGAERPAPPQTTTIGGRTYIGSSDRRTVPNANLHLENQRLAGRSGTPTGTGGFYGAGGTIWTPVGDGPNSGGGGPQPGPGPGGPGGGGPEVPLSLSTLLSDYGQAFGGTLPREVAPDRASRQAANSAAFGRAKDRIGLANRASLNALRGVMQERGMAGSGLESAGVSSIIAGGRGEIADTIRDQTMADLNREQQVEDRNYSGNINQRGQDLQAREHKLRSLQALFSMRGAPPTTAARIY